MYRSIVFNIGVHPCVTTFQTKIYNIKGIHEVSLMPSSLSNPPEVNRYSDSNKHPLAFLRKFSNETKENCDKHLIGNCFSLNLPTVFSKYKYQTCGAKILMQIFKPFLSKVPPHFVNHALGSLFLQDGSGANQKGGREESLSCALRALPFFPQPIHQDPASSCALRVLKARARASPAALMRTN